MSKTQDYIDQYAQYAMEQMERYGIPASITLAQALLESGKGESRLARQENNHFGIKATKEWLDNGGRFGIYTDDKPNEKFCSYQSVRDSFEHHSRFIVYNSRYKDCLNLPINDYRGWAQKLQKAGYATSSSYSKSLISIIESNNLQKYDQMVISSPGRYSTDYQADLPDMANKGNYRGLNRENIADTNALANDDKESRSTLSTTDKDNNNPEKDQDIAKGTDPKAPDEDFESWMRKLLADGEDEDKSQSNGMDPITDMVITMFTSLFAIAAMIDNKTPLEQSSEARRAVNDQEVDLTPILKEQNSKALMLGIDPVLGTDIGVDKAIVNHADKAQSTNGSKDSLAQGNLASQTDQTLPEGMKPEDIRSCKFRITEQAKATLVIEDNMGRTHSFEVGSKELTNLQNSLNKPQMNPQQKSMAVVAFIAGAMSRSIERENSLQRGNSNSVQHAKQKYTATSIAVAKANTNPNGESSLFQSLPQNSHPSPTITISTAAQMSSRNYEIAQSQSQSREGQSYSL